MAQQPTAQVPTSDLLKQLATQSVELVEKEVELAKSELRQEVAEGKGVAERVGVAAVLALVGLQGLVLAAVFGLARLVPDWAAALMVAGCGILASAVFALVTRHRMKSALPRTSEVVSGELTWLKKQLR
jgi:uncharacterized membrane protein YqjE